MTTLTPVLVEVCPGCVIWRHGRAWVGGDRLNLAPGDAANLASHGTVREVR